MRSGSTPLALLSFLLGGLILGPPGSAWAQTGPAPFSAGAGAQFQYFDFSDSQAIGLESISLFSVPMSARIRLGGPVRVEASTTFARGELSRPGGQSVTLSGLTDSQLRLVSDLVDERVTVSAALSIPTGADGFSAEEAGLAGAIAADLLPFAISSWGAGGGVGGGISVFQPAGDFGLGFSAGYMVPGEFSPIDQSEFQYRPGATLNLQGIVDYTVGQAGRAALQVAYSRFQDDEIEGQNLYRSGDRIQARASYSFAAGTMGSGVVYGGYLHRSEGTFLDDLRARPSQGLFFAGGGVRQPWRGMTLVPSAELRVQRRDDGEDQGTLAGAGVELEVPAGGALLVPRLMVRGGSVLVREGVDSGVLGLEAGVSLRHGGSR